MTYLYGDKSGSDASPRSILFLIASGQISPSQFLSKSDHTSLFPLLLFESIRVGSKTSQLKPLVGTMWSGVSDG